MGKFGSICWICYLRACICWSAASYGQFANGIFHRKLQHRQANLTGNRIFGVLAKQISSGNWLGSLIPAYSLSKVTTTVALDSEIVSNLLLLPSFYLFILLSHTSFSYSTPLSSMTVVRMPDGLDSIAYYNKWYYLFVRLYITRTIYEWYYLWAVLSQSAVLSSAVLSISDTI